MGGICSGRYGPRSARRTVERVQAVTVREVLRVIPLRSRHVAESQSGVRLTTTTQPNGALRWWMQCPCCNRRCGVLYQIGVALACRRCHRLVYQSQRLTASKRLSYRASKLFARIRCSRTDDFFYRPKGMHWTTFARLLAAAEAYDNAAVEAAISPAMRSVLHNCGVM